MVKADKIEKGGNSLRLARAKASKDFSVSYPLSQAVEIVKECATAKFDESVDVAINLGIDTRQSDQNLRGVISLPNGTGKTVRVAVFARDAKAQEAKDAGADVVGAEDLIEEISKGNINFDRCIATPDMMPLLGKVAKILGPKGLMPNPKLGTVTQDVSQAVKSALAGQVEYRAEKSGIVHAIVGKVSFENKKLEENIKAFYSEILRAKPSAVKGTYMKKVHISSTMGPSVKLIHTEI